MTILCKFKKRESYCNFIEVVVKFFLVSNIFIEKMLLRSKPSKENKDIKLVYDIKFFFIMSIRKFALKMFKKFSLFY